MRLTKQRKLIIDLLIKAKKPLSAEAILTQLPPDIMNLSTIYRNLDSFHQAGLLGKSIMEGRSYYYHNDGSHHHYMICKTCQKMVPIDCHLDELTKRVARQANFKITGHDMTVYGYCQTCQKD